MSDKGFEMSKKESPLEAHNQDKNQTKKKTCSFCQHPISSKLLKKLFPKY